MATPPPKLVSQSTAENDEGVELASAHSGSHVDRLLRKKYVDLINNTSEVVYAIVKSNPNHASTREVNGNINAGPGGGGLGLEIRKVVDPVQIASSFPLLPNQLERVYTTSWKVLFSFMKKRGDDFYYCKQDVVIPHCGSYDINEEELDYTVPDL